MIEKEYNKFLNRLHKIRIRYNLSEIDNPSAYTQVSEPNAMPGGISTFRTDRTVTAFTGAPAYGMPGRKSGTVSSGTDWIPRITVLQMNAISS